VRNQIPESYLDLVNGPPVAALTTVMPDGQPQTTVVWCNFDGTHLLVNTMRGFRKEKNKRLNPKVTLLCYDPRQPLRSLEVRGTVVEMTEAGAMEHLDKITRQYSNYPHYYGYIYPVEQQDQETRIICRIHATKITLDAIHK
jgi:PPOX class probable F420-dependent enzyme